jgi:hypothetical protein
MIMKIFGMEVNLVCVAISIVIGMFIACNTICSCKIPSMEGMSSLDSNMHEGVPSSANAWKVSDYPKAKSSCNDFRHLAPEAQMSGMHSDDQMDFFSNTVFAPQCCPSSYSNGKGCACLNAKQMDFLNQRGGNRTMSE